MENRQVSRLWRREVRSVRRSSLPDAEQKQLGVARALLQHVTGLAHQIRDIDGRERVGTFEHERIARREFGQRLARLERWQRAFESAQIENGFGHSPLIYGGAGGRATPCAGLRA